MQDSFIWRALFVVAWAIVCILTVLSVLFCVYQMYALFVPYLLSKMSGQKHQFPDYFYKVPTFRGFRRPKNAKIVMICKNLRQNAPIFPSWH